MNYATKYRIVNAALPVLVVAAFGVAGMHATRHLFAQSLPTPTLVLTVSKPQYQLGEAVIATISNTSPTNVYIMNNCPNEPLTVSRLTSAGWITVQDTAPITKCAGEPQDYEVPADRSIRISYTDWPLLFDNPGAYRIHAAIEPGQQGPTTQFTVTN